MTTNVLTYPLIDGYVHNWLVMFECPPEDTPPSEFDSSWTYVRANNDHFLSEIFRFPLPDITWVYTEIVCDTGDEALFALSTYGVSAIVKVNGVEIHQQHTFSTDSTTETFSVQLQPGVNQILIKLLQWHIYPMKLRWIDAPATANVQIPTRAADLERRAKFERVFAQAALERDVYTGNNRVVVRWPDDYEELCWLTARLQTREGRIYAESTKMLNAETRTIDLGTSHNLPVRDMEVLLIPRPQEYYEGLRFERRLPLLVMNNAWSSGLYGADEGRRIEALEFVAQLADLDVVWWQEIAKIGLGHDVDLTKLEYGIVDAHNFDDVSAIVVAGAGLRSSLPPSYAEEIHNAVLADFFYQNPEMPCAAAWTLAAQLETTRTRDQEIPHLKTCLTNAAENGFNEDSHQVATDIVALTHLVDLAESDEVRELAAILLDKLLFMVAVNSYQGVYAAAERDPRSDFIAPIARVLWGLGAWNDEVEAPVSLAIAEHYQVPSLIQAIALDQPDKLWATQQQAGISRATYKTPDYMLTAAQTWRAVFAPDTIVAPSQRHWPHECRIAQWHDALIDLRRLPANDPVGYTCIGWPSAAFDEMVLRENWAFARHGDAYLAITASQPITLTPDRRSLRASGSAWIVQMGGTAVDGEFAQFQAAILALAPDFGDSSVTFTTLRGDALAFNWDDPLHINGDLQPPYKHFDSPYCVAETGDPMLEIRYRDYAMRLQFDS